MESLEAAFAVKVGFTAQTNSANATFGAKIVATKLQQTKG